MSSFLTVKEAAVRTGKSPTSIRRIIYAILPDDQHPDRHHIEPSPAQAKELRSKGENFPWKISVELLNRAVPVGAAEKKGSDAADRATQSAEMQLVAMLQRELEIKNQQIAQQSELLSRQMQLIDGLGERLREGNILIGSLQQRLALPESVPHSTVVDAKAPKTGEGDSSMSKKPAKAPSKPKPKRRFFGLFA